ncbi:MAG: integrase [Colwellia sp.]|nr:integrase [Colwellia sp.]
MNSKVTYRNRAFKQALAESRTGISEVNSPDILTVSSSGVYIPDEFILCRDQSNVPTAIYKNDKWDLTPYILSSKSSETIYFADLKCTNEEIKDQKLVDEVKKIGVCLMYFINTGMAGGLAVSTLTRYVNTAKKVAHFCIDTRKDRMVGRLTLEALLGNKSYLAFYTKTLDKREKQRLHALLKKLNIIGKHRLGYEVIHYEKLHEPIPHNQHPVIPTRIYLEMVNHLTDRVEFLKKKTIKLEEFIKRFSDPCFGLCLKNQKKLMFAAGIELKDRVFRPTLTEAIREHAVKSLFNHPDFICKDRRQLAAVLGVIQYEMKHVIHLYTGMRNDEINRLNYKCVFKKDSFENIFNDKSDIPAPNSIVKVISTTTKFTGFKKEESWLAHTIVLDAIKILRRITRGIAYISDLNVDDCSLLLTTSSIYLRKQKTNGRKVLTSPKLHRKYFQNHSKFLIDKNDYDVLVASDPERDFSASPEFDCGKQWPLTTHQFRRSLAFYAVNSGFVSLATLRKQFKHLSQEMIKYYSRNNENVMTIFGHYDVKAKEYVLPLNHIAYELQTGMSLATAESLLKDLLDEENSLHGKTGGYFEKQRERLGNEDVLVEEFLEVTAKKVHDGEVSYRKTLLGGCTNTDICSCSILGEFADCLTSKCAVIKSENIDSLIKSTEIELKSYNKHSVEYLSTKSELEDLIRYKTHNVERKTGMLEG